MDIIRQIVSNKILITAFAGYFTAQVVKAVLEAVMDHTFSFRRLMTGNGGMPSSHASTVTALATMTAFTSGVDSFQFAFSVIFAIVVMVDASGVRRETGNQAKVLNEMIEAFAKMSDKSLSNDDKLKELIGHTPFQVAVGAVLGIVLTLIICSACYGLI